MVQVWYLDSQGNQPEDPEVIKVEELLKKTGVQYIQLNLDTYTTDGILDKLKVDRGYNYEDEMACAKSGLPADEAKLKSFLVEHLHADEEIRFFVEGSGDFDVRDVDDRWVRIHVVPGDMIILPGGIYHRFSIDSYCKMRRYFTEEPVWKAHNRPAEDLTARKDYVEKLQNGHFIAQYC